MKVRSGFVSNSSTSSFCTYGVATDYDEIVKLFFDGKNAETTIERRNACYHSFDRENQKFCAECGKQSYIEYTRGGHYDTDDMEKAIYEKCGTSLSVETYDEEESTSGDVYYVGSSRMDGGEAGLKDMLAVNAKLKELFGREGDFNFGTYAC